MGLSSNLTPDQLDHALRGLEMGSICLANGDLVGAQKFFAAFWSDEGIGSDYDDFDPADDVAFVERAIADVLGDDQFSGQADELDQVIQEEVRSSASTRYARWVDYLDEAIDELSMRG
jgi:hypothetical protein